MAVRVGAESIVLGISSLHTFWGCVVCGGAIVGSPVVLRCGFVDGNLLMRGDATMSSTVLQPHE